MPRIHPALPNLPLWPAHLAAIATTFEGGKRKLRDEEIADLLEALDAWIGSRKQFAREVQEFAQRWK